MADLFFQFVLTTCDHKKGNDMIADFCKKLENAEARFEFVVAVFCDIRSFSTFSKTVESPDTSTFLKHFYLKLLRDYFQDAVFAKPTGDGLLIIYKHTEKNLNEVSEIVLSRCFKAVKDFPKMFKSIPIINYVPPASIGFGIARGSASYLFVENEILDYSGKLLNLAARLNELARPKGIVIDGNYQEDVISIKFRKRFQVKDVFVRGIAEEIPVKVFYSDEVTIPPSALHRIKNPTRKLSEESLTVKKVLNLNANYRLTLPESARKDDIRAEYVWVDKKDDLMTSRFCQNPKYEETARGFFVSFDSGETKKIIHELLEKDSVVEDSEFTFRVDYVPSHSG